jgi:hypothetical protein
MASLPSWIVSRLKILAPMEPNGLDARRRTARMFPASGFLFARKAPRHVMKERQDQFSAADTRPDEFSVSTDDRRPIRPPPDLPEPQW